MTKPKVLCPIDCSPCSANALRFAEEWASRIGGELSLLMAYQVPHYVQPSLLIWMGAGPRPLWELAQEQAVAEVRDFASANALSITPESVQIVHGDPAVSIVAVAENGKHDWIVMGTHGRSGPKRWALGSVAERVVRRAPCPVLVIPTRDDKVTDKPILEPRLL
jgi:nucleotide-binding universal stress UspA family protein